MLARSAQGLYWMGRYLERTKHVCRLLGLQTAALVDRPVQEIHSGWSRIYNSMGRLPPGGSLERDSTDEFTLADSFTLADDLTFERSNPDSVWTCLSSGRENARQMRHCISPEMWTRLNLAYLRIQKLDILEIWSSSPESFYVETAAEMDTFMGVAAATMYRDEGWHFTEVGRYIERAQLAASLFLAQLAEDPATEEEAAADWTNLLHAYSALETYQSRYGIEVRPTQALDLLATDPLVPGSLCRSLDVMQAELVSIGSGPNAASSAAAQRVAGRLRALIHYEWPDAQDHKGILERVVQYCRDLHDMTAVTYFDYTIESLPMR